VSVRSAAHHGARQAADPVVQLVLRCVEASVALALQASFVTRLGEFGDRTKPPEFRNGSQPDEPEASPVGGARPHSQGNFADQGDETDDCLGA
jgi:hypothetical protein